MSEINSRMGKVVILSIVVSLSLLGYFVIDSSITGYTIFEDQWEHSLQVTASTNDSIITQEIIFDQYKPSSCEDGILVTTSSGDVVDYSIINETYENDTCIKATIQFSNIIYENNITNQTNTTINDTLTNETNTTLNESLINETLLNDTNITDSNVSINDSNITIPSMDITLPEDTNDTNTTINDTINDSQINDTINESLVNETNTTINDSNVTEPINDSVNDTNTTIPDTNTTINESVVNETESESQNNDTVEEVNETDSEDEPVEDETSVEEESTETQEETDTEEGSQESEQQSDTTAETPTEETSEDVSETTNEESNTESNEESSSETESSDTESESPPEETPESGEESSESEPVGDGITGAVSALIQDLTSSEEISYTIYYGDVFESIDFEVNYGEYIQGPAYVDVPVNWTQNIIIENPSNYSLEKDIELEFPEDISNLTILHDGQLFSENSNFSLELEAQENKTFLAKFQTSAVSVEIQEVDLELISLLPPEAREIKVKLGEQLVGTYPNLQQANLKLPGTEKKIFVYHNASLHYHNITVELPSTENASFSRIINGSKVEAKNEISKTSDKLIWIVPRLSGANASVSPEVVKRQGRARVGEPVNWTLEVDNYTVNYETPAPEKVESNSTGKKTVTVISEATDHYYNVSAFTELPELSYRPRIKRIINGSRVDVTNISSYNVTYLDTNNNSKYDKVEWIVPRLSNDTYEIELVILNVKSEPSTQGNWTVMFNTSGTADLTIQSTNGTTWSTNNETEDLKFLDLKCGNNSINYSWSNNTVFVENYSCNNETSYEISKVITTGPHHLSFTFGSITKYAHNDAWLTPSSVSSYSSEDSSYTSGNSIDDSNSSLWKEDRLNDVDGEVYDWYITYDMGSTYSFSKIRVYADGDGIGSPCKIGDIKVCDDSACSGESNLISSDCSFSNNLEWQECNFSATEGRYIYIAGGVADRTTCINKDSKYYLDNFYEFDAYASLNLELLNISTNESIYNSGETVLFNSYINASSLKDVMLLIDDSMFFSACNYSNTSGCLANSSSITPSGSSEQLNATMTASEDTFWHSRLCDEENTCVSYMEDTENWNITFEGEAHDTAHGIDINSQGEVFVTLKAGIDGATTYDIVTLKYASNGTLIGNTSIDSGESDQGNGITIDSEDNVYVVGILYGVDYELFVAKYNSSLDHIWNSSFPSPYGRSYGRSVVLDSNDNVYAAGEGENITGNENGMDWGIFKINSSDGSEIWNLTFDGGSGNDIVYSLAIDSNDNVYAAGYGENVTGNGDADWWIKKFDSAGNEDTSWNLTFDGGSGNDVVYSLAIDSNDNVYAAGYGDNVTGNGNGWDWWIKKFDSAGNEDTSWNLTFDGGSSHDDLKASVYSQGNIYFSGTRYSSDTDAWFKKIDPLDGSFVLNTAPTFHNISTDKTLYNNSDTITFSSNISEVDNDTIALLISNTSSFTNCNYSTRSGCIADSNNVTLSPIGEVQEVNATVSANSLPGDNTWYAQVCDEYNNCYYNVIAYQEFANVSDNSSQQTSSDEDPPVDNYPDLMNYSGQYNSGLGSSYIDGNWSSYNTGVVDSYLNYSLPSHVFGAKWQMKDSEDLRNISIPGDCLGYNQLKLRVYVQAAGPSVIFNYYCYNYSTLSYTELYDSGMEVNSNRFEEAIWWNYSFSGDITVDLGDPNVTVNTITTTDAQGEYVRGTVEMNATVNDTGAGLKDNSGQYSLFTGAAVWKSAEDNFTEGDESGLLNNTWNTELCYQEQADESDEKDGPCDLNYSGSYNTPNGDDAWADGSWSSFCSGFGWPGENTCGGNNYVTYTLPNEVDSVIWKYKAETYEDMGTAEITGYCYNYSSDSWEILWSCSGEGEIVMCNSNVSVPSECINNSEIQFKIYVNQVGPSELTLLYEEGLYYNGSNEGINYSYNFRVNDTLDNRNAGDALWTVVCNDLDTKSNCSALSPTACEQESYWWYDSGSGQDTCCGDDSEEYWNASDSFGCCCNSTPIANNTVDEQCEDYSNYWCIDGVYCVENSGLVRDQSLNAGDTNYSLGGDDIVCGCDSSGDKCDSDRDSTAEGVCASDTCDTDLVSKASDGATTYYSGCDTGRVCDSDVTPSEHEPRYVRDGYCAQSTCATSFIMADNDGTECGTGTSGCTQHNFTDGDETQSTGAGNQGTVCSSNPESGDPPTADGISVAGEGCDTGEVAVNCTTDGCSNTDLFNGNIWPSCSGHASEACDADVESIGFEQDGVCTSDGNCDNSGHIAYNGSSYLSECGSGSINYSDTCDREVGSGGDFEADGVCGDSSHTDCCTSFARNASGAATGPGYCNNEITVCGAGYEGYYCDYVGDASWDAGDTAGTNKFRCDEDTTACIDCSPSNMEYLTSPNSIFLNGDGKCEAGCGADASCDETDLGGHNGNSCCYSSCSADTEIHSGDSVTWDMCDFSSQSGSNDYCYDDSEDKCYYQSGDSCDSSNGWGDSGGSDFDNSTCYDPGYVSGNLCYYDNNSASADEANSCSSTGCIGIDNEDWTSIVGSCDYGLWSDALVNCSVESSDTCYHSTDGCVDSGADGSDGWDYINVSCDDYDVDGSGNIINESEINSTSCTSTCSGSSCCEIQTATCEAAQECNYSYDLLTNEDDTTNQTCYYSNAGSWLWDASAEATETTCDDGYDNDCDGYIDMQDEDCDSSAPVISWENPTPDDDEVKDQDWITLNTTITDTSNTSAFFDWNNSLVGYWSFENSNSTGIYDNSSYNNFATFNGGVSESNLTRGKYGDALEFDGSGDYLEVSDSSLDLIGNKTIEAWIYPEAFDAPGGTDRRIIINRIDSSTAYQLSCWSSEGFVFAVNDGGSQYIVSSDNSGSGYSTNQWYHLVGTYDDSSNSVTLYINGVSVSDGSASGWGLGNSGNVQIGRRSDDGGYFDGKIDEVKIYDRILSSEEVEASYNNNANRLYHNFTSLDEGDYDYSAYAIDEGGHIATESRNVTIDRTPPSLTINSPNSDSILDSKTVTVNLTVTDTNLNYTEVEIKQGESVIDSTTSSSEDTFTVELTVSTDGIYNITATAYDLGGKTNSSTVTNITLDTTEPTPSDINYYGVNCSEGGNPFGCNDNFEIYYKHSGYFNTTWSDALSGLDSWWFSWNESGDWSNLTSDTFSGTLSSTTQATSESSSTDVYWKFCANDSAGNSNCTAEQNFTILAPSPSISFSDNLTAGVTWNITSLPAINEPSQQNNDTGDSLLYVTLNPTGCKMALYINGTDLTNTTTIAIGNESLRYGNSDSTLESTYNQTSLSNSIINIGTDLADNTIQYLKFYINISGGQPTGKYTNDLNIEGNCSY